METKNSLRLRIKYLASIILGLGQALDKLELSDDERSVVAKLLEKSSSEYNSAMQAHKEHHNQQHLQNPKPKRPKRAKPKTVDNIQLSYVKKRDKKIQDTHRVSGFGRKWITIVQGGAPGSGKGS